MITFLIRRLLAIVPVTLGVIVIVSLLIHSVPGDPVDVILGEYATLEEKSQLRSNLGLDRPINYQITVFFQRISQGDLGTSILTNEPVLEMIATRAPATIELAILSLIVAILLSIPLGITSALKSGKALDHFSMFFALIGVAIPNFWLGPMLILVFSLELELFPVSERGGWLSYVLPSLTMGTALSAILCRMTRTSILEVLKEEYVRTARAKGIRPSIVILKHVMRNASIPLISIVGLQFGALLTGAIITEKIFDWPGLGTLILEGIQNRDYPVVQGCVFVFSFSYVIVNLLTDLAYGFFDPRISLESKSAK